MASSKSDGRIVIVRLELSSPHYECFSYCFDRLPLCRSWEWQRDYAIRSYLPLLPLIAGYRFLYAFGVRSSWIWRSLPRLLQTLLTIISDLSLYRICLHAQGDVKDAAWTVLDYCMSTFSAFTMVRTLSNSTETSLFILLTELVMITKTTTSESTGNNNKCLLKITIIIVWMVFTRPTAVLLVVRKKASISQSTLSCPS